MKTLPSIIAIDGPAASGKSTLAKNLAEHLGYLYFDTGVMYRAVTWVGLERGYALDDEELITSLAERTRIDVQPPSVEDGRAYDVLVDGRDVTWQIRQPEVDAYVSLVSAYPGVRLALSAQQRRVGLRGEVVMVGRDIGTVVLPEADLKLYLVASAEERARRRFTELDQRGEHVTEGAILDAVMKRDQIDSSRDVSPLRPAEDAVILDSEGLDSEQVLNYVKALIAQANTTDRTDSSP